MHFFFFFEDVSHNLNVYYFIGERVKVYYYYQLFMHESTRRKKTILMNIISYLADNLKLLVMIAWSYLVINETKLPNDTPKIFYSDVLRIKILEFISLFLKLPRDGEHVGNVFI